MKYACVRRTRTRTIIMGTKIALLNLIKNYIPNFFLFVWKKVGNICVLVFVIAKWGIQKETGE